MRQRIKDAPEELACEVQLFLRGDPEVGPACGKAVIFPAALVVVGKELKARDVQRRHKPTAGSEGPGRQRGQCLQVRCYRGRMGCFLENCPRQLIRQSWYSQ